MRWEKLSLKYFRFVIVETGNITDEQLINVIDQYKPEKVFLRHFEWTKVDNFLNKNYQLKKQDNNLKLYVKFPEK